MNTVNYSEKRPYGQGGLYLRGKRWYIYYSKGGRSIREATGSTDAGFARKLLEHRLDQSQGHLPPRLVTKDPDRDECLTPIRVGRRASRANTGAIAELLVSSELLNRGLFVFRSVSTNASCDLIAIDPAEPHKTIRYEVKTADERETARRLKPSKDNRFDILALVSRKGFIEYIPRGSARFLEVCGRPSRARLGHSEATHQDDTVSTC